MYHSFYGLTRAPFANIPDPDCLFMSPQHQRALSVLQYTLMTRAGFCVITGNVGAGKTTLVRSLLKNVSQDIDVGLVSNTHCESFEELMRWILLAFDLDYRGKDKIEMYDELVGYLIDRFTAGTPVTLIIDEAQHLGIENLEQLRMLSNVNTERGQILQTILVGQPELWDLLRRRELEQFTQRISYDFYLPPLESPELVAGYIKHRLKYAGIEAKLFEPGIYELVWSATGGVPRLINLVCDTALLYGYAEQQKVISRAIVEKVIADKAGSVIPMQGVIEPAGNGRYTPDDRGSTPRRPPGSSIERAALKRKPNR